jgi:hypothetical protein
MAKPHCGSLATDLDRITGRKPNFSVVITPVPKPAGIFPFPRRQGSKSLFQTAILVVPVAEPWKISDRIEQYRD